NPALRPLWAHEKVRALETDEIIHKDAELQRQITNLGITYELLTSHTSFVGVDETPKEQLADAQTVTQPAPLPQGATNNAVGSGQVVAAGNPVTHAPGATPEPRAMTLLILALASLLLYRDRRIAR